MNGALPSPEGRCIWEEYETDTILRRSPAPPDSLRTSRSSRAVLSSYSMSWDREERDELRAMLRNRSPN